MKVRILKDEKEYRKGDVVDVTPNVAFGLIDRGIAAVDRMFDSPKTGSKVVKK